MRSVSWLFLLGTHARGQPQQQKSNESCSGKRKYNRATYTSRGHTVSCLAQLCWLQFELQAGNGREEMVQVQRDATVFRIEGGKVVLASVVEAVAAALLQQQLLLAVAPPLLQGR